MDDFINPLPIFDLGIDHSKAMLKKWRKISAGQVTVFVDRGCNDSAAVFQIPRRVICATSKK
jgi:hypothetical protein